MTGPTTARIALLIAAVVAETAWAAPAVSVWTQAQYGEADQSRRAALQEYEVRFQGAALGVAVQPSEAWRLGLSYRGLQAELEQEGQELLQLDGEFVRGTARFTSGRFAFDLGLSHGRVEHDQPTAADYTSTSLGADALFGYRYPLQGTVVVEPLLQLRYARSDAERSRPLHEIGEVGIGLRWTGHFQAGPGRLEQQIRMMALRDYIADAQGTTTLMLLGEQAVVSHPARPRRHSYQAGLGMNYYVGDFTLGARYDYLERSDYYAHHLAAEIRYAF